MPRVGGTPRLVHRVLACAHSARVIADRARLRADILGAAMDVLVAVLAAFGLATRAQIEVEVEREPLCCGDKR